MIHWRHTTPPSASFNWAGLQSPKELTTDFTYVRLHGPGDKYQGKYHKQTLNRWMGAFSSWQRKGCDAYCYFDNDDSGYAAQNAQELQEVASGK